jgi:hypothetical protein
MRMRVRWALLLLVALGSAAAAGERNPAGDYRLVGEQDVASGIRLQSDGRFQYFLIAGALDEQATGRWSLTGGVVTLVTEPKPVPPRFSQAPSKRAEGAALAVRIDTPQGRGLAGVDLRVGFDQGEPVEGYTQEDGWTLPAGERRPPRWIELSVPMHRLASPRFPIDLAAGNALAFTLVPNDLGILDFEGITIRVAGKALIVERDGARLRYEAAHK